MSAPPAPRDPGVITASEPGSTDPEHVPGLIDPRAVRVSVTEIARLAGDPTIVISPPAVPIEPLRDQLAGVGILGGAANPPSPAAVGEQPLDENEVGRADQGLPLVDGEPVNASLGWVDEQRAVLVRRNGLDISRTAVVLGPLRERATLGTFVREVLVGGWRVDVELEPERRAVLRERARRAKEATGRSGPLEVHAIIPGRIVAISVAPGDAVVAGQQILVLEAMKMQNELRAPREGTVERVAVAVGVNVEVGDLLLVIS
ncbi:MAG: acetyl-CoA carboxylase biotin carboxyl carrier protein subunit [Acidimicrobiales bacterium]